MKEKVIKKSLPFYGKSGTISRIETIYDDTYTDTPRVSYYLKYEYDKNGNEKSYQIVPKKKHKELEDSYYNDLNMYLKANADKYHTYKSTRLKKTRKDTEIYTDILISSLIMLSGIGLTIKSLSLGVDAGTTYLGVVIAGAAGSYDLISGMDLVALIKDNKKKKFINKYEALQSDLNNYNIRSEGKSKDNVTRYKGISNEKMMGNTLKKTKTLVLE